MNISERRKKILEIFYEKKSLSYEEILEETSGLGDPVDILSDIDTLVFFRFLQNVGVKRSEILPETRLELRPNTRNQIENNPSRIDSRLEELEHEFPPWYRKRAILTVLNRKMSADEIYEAVHKQYTHVEWPLPLIEASLKILRDSHYISRKKENDIVTYRISPKGESLLKQPPIQQFLDLRELKDEFTYEFRTYEILRLVVEYGSVSSGEILRHFQSEYGIRGNKRRAIGNTLKKMAFSGLLRVRGATEKKGGYIYCLGETIESLFKERGEIMYHSIKDFKGTVEQFFEKYRTTKGIQSTVEKTLDDLDQCREDMLQKPPDHWMNHVVGLSGYLHEETQVWEKKMLQSICACILSRLLPPDIAVEMLKDYHPPSPTSEEEYTYYSGVAREYYFNLTEAYLILDNRERALQSFDCLNLLSWESPDFWVLKGRVEVLKRDIRIPEEFKYVITSFEEALKTLKGKERIGALFYKGLLQYQRGDLEEAIKAWEECLGLVSSTYWKTTLYHNLANVYRLSGELKRARKYYTASANFAHPPPEMDEPIDMEVFYELRAKSLLGLTNALIDSCLWDEAEEKLKQIIQESEEKKVPLITAMAKTNLGDLLTRKRLHEEALVCHKEALKLIDEERHPRESGIILINEGNTLRLLKRGDAALQKFEKARTLISRENSMLIQNLCICEADLHIDMENLEKGWELSHAVLQESWLGKSRSVAEAYRIQGKVNLRRGRVHEAVNVLKKSEGILKSLSLQYELLEVYELLELCYQNLRDDKEASYKAQRKALQKDLGLL